MDTITRELDDLVFEYEDDDKMTDVACCNKIKMDYYLMLTIAALWDLKHNNFSEQDAISIMSRLQRPETGKLIQLLALGLNLDSSIVDIFDIYKTGRNLIFGHSTFDEYQAQRLNQECEKCWTELMSVTALSEEGDIIRRIYQEENDFYYISKVRPDGELRVKQFGNRKAPRKFPKLELISRLANSRNQIKEGDLFLAVDGTYIKISPFIQYNDQDNLFMMLMDVETKPLAFKMAYIYRTSYARDSAIYLDEFPVELRPYFPENNKSLGKNGVTINRFSQYDLFKQEYYRGIHQDVISQMNDFISGNMAYGAVHGIAGVGKTSAVFMWMNNLLDNQDGILDSVRQRFNLRRILFLSAKTKVYSRNINSDSLSNFDEIESDVSNYHDVIERIYAAFHQQEKKGITFEEKVDFVKNYSNRSQGVLVIIDDYESLPASSRREIQSLKDSLMPDAIKILITTRFISMESKEITVKILDESDCAKMTDHIFASKNWRLDMTTAEMHRFTGGRPLLIWYAKAYYQTGQLSSTKLKSRFSGPAKGLDSYLFDNFVQCFKSTFTHNFLMMTMRYYKLHQTLQISKKIAVFLCLENLKEYKPEDDEFYFMELMDLKLISINQSTGSIDFSPLMTYMDQSANTQEPTEQYQKDNMKVLTQLDEEKYNGLFAVIESAEYLDNETKCRILERVIEIAKNDIELKTHSLRKIFAISDDKLKFYYENTQLFQSNETLIKALLNYFIDNPKEATANYEISRDFLKSISVTIEKKDDTESIAYKGIEVVDNLLADSLEKREAEVITNYELESRAQLLRNIAFRFINRIKENSDIKQDCIEYINIRLEDIGIYCQVSPIYLS